MNNRKLLINTVIIGALAMAPLIFSSCSDDSDDDNSISKPDIAEGKAKATLSGDSNDEIVADGNISVINDDGNTIILWSDSDNNDLRMGFNEIGKTGTYDAAIQSRVGFVEIFYNGETWQSQNGKIGITTNNENRIAGTINDVELKRKDQGKGSLTVNGEFNASKNVDSAGDPSIPEGEADVETSGEENASLTGNGAVFVDTSQTIQGQKSESLIISYADTAGNSMTVTFTAAGDNASLGTGTYEPLDLQNPSNEYVSVRFNINGNTYSSIEAGNVELLSQSSSNAAAKFNDLEVSSATGSNTITVTGEVNAEAK